MKKRRIKWIYLVVVIALMGLIEKNFTYWPKSIFKVFLFLVIPYFMFKLKYDYKKIIINKTAVYLSLAVILGIVVTYFIVGTFLDYNLIKLQLLETMNVKRGNFLWIGLYISFVNAFIEEFFFRGLYFLEENKKRNTWISASAFAMYHGAIMNSWVSLPLLILASAGLLLVGLVFNSLTLKEESIFNSYFVHMIGNLAINIIAYTFIL